jgi:hypothetical protein
MLLQPHKRSYYPDPSILEIPHDHFHQSNTDPMRWTVCSYHDRDNKYSEPCNHPYNDTAVFAFQAPAWTDAEFQTLILSKVFRQTDETWIRTLNEIKTGRCGSEASTLIRGLQRPLAPAAELLPTMLYTHRASVEDENHQKYQELKGEEMVVDALDEGEICDERGHKQHMSALSLEKHGESCC